MYGEHGRARMAYICPGDPMHTQKERFLDFGVQLVSSQSPPTEAGKTAGESKGGREHEATVNKTLMRLMRVMCSFWGAQIREVHDEQGNKIPRSLAVTNGDRGIVLRLPSLHKIPGAEELLMAQEQPPVVIPKEAKRYRYPTRIFIAESERGQEAYQTLFRQGGYLEGEDPDTVRYEKTGEKTTIEDTHTKFDGTLLLVDDIESADVSNVRKKILLESKAAKGVKGGHTLAGNAHERLAFQAALLRFLPNRGYDVELVSITNEAFWRHPSKYKVLLEMVLRDLAQGPEHLTCQALGKPAPAAEWGRSLFDFLFPTMAPLYIK